MHLEPVPVSRPESSQPGAESYLTRNDFTKAFHRTLLQVAGIDRTRAFWSRHPLSRGGTNLSLRELAEHAWRDDALEPLSWSLGVLNDIEAFLVEHDLDFAEFLRTMRCFANNSSFIDSRRMLTWLTPILVPLFRFGDPYRLTLQAFRVMAARVAPSVICEFARRRAESGGAAINSGSLWLTFPGLLEGRIPAWDVPTLTADQLRIAPRTFGLPPFASTVVHADARKAETIPWVDTTSVKNDTFFIGDLAHGRLMSFGEFCRQAGYDLPSADVDCAPVVVVNREYTCPKRKRPVLVAGCAYGAPGYLMHATWRLDRPPVRNFLSIMLGDTEPSAAGRQARLDALQSNYLQAVTPVISVVYSASEQGVYVAGRYICGGVQARILCECARVIQDEGQREFTYREFKRDPNLVSHPKNTGFETRLARLRQALAEADCGLQIDHVGRGKFRVWCGGRITFEQIA